MNRPRQATVSPSGFTLCIFYIYIDIFFVAGDGRVPLWRSHDIRGPGYNKDGTRLFPAAAARHAGIRSRDCFLHAVSILKSRELPSGKQSTRLHFSVHSLLKNMIYG